MILTDGQCHYAFVVETEPGAQERVVASLNGWQADVRRAGGFGVATMEALCARVGAVPGVRSARPLGPRMAMPLALRMATGLTGIPGVFSSHAGTGPITGATRRDFTTGHIRWEVQKTTAGDMAATFLVTDPSASRESVQVFLRPVSSKQQNHVVRFSEADLAAAEGFMLGRVSQSLERVMDRMRRDGKQVSLRIYQYGRYAPFEEYAKYFPKIDHLMLDDGNEAMRQTALKLGIRPPRGWPLAPADIQPTLDSVAARLNERAGHPLLQIFPLRFREEIWLAGAAGLACSRLPLDTGGRACDPVIASRAQGALLAAVLRPRPEFALGPNRQPATRDGLQAMARWIHHASLHGIVNVPWVWPGPGFTEAAMRVLA